MPGLLSGRPAVAIGAIGLAAALAGCVAAGVRISDALAGPGLAASITGPAPSHDRPAGGALPFRSGRAAASAPPAGRSGIPLRPRRVPPPAVRLVSGSSVTAVGDSIMVASTPALQQALPGIYIDAMVGRQFSTGVQIVASLASQGLLRPVVVVGLGTNGTVSTADISQLLAEIGPHRSLVLVNTFAARPWEPGVNAVLAATAGSRPRVVLANWHAAIDHRTYLLWDGIHPQPGGALIYASIVTAAVKKAASPAG